MSSVLEPVFVLVFWSSIIACHFHLVYIVRRKTLTTTAGITSQVHCKWVQSVMEDRRDILAVQTFRNQMVAATFSYCYFLPVASS
jgi:hypothetical protein